MLINIVTRLSLILLITIAPLSAWGDASAVAEKPDVHSGDRWSYQHTDGMTNEPDYTWIVDVVNVSDKEIRARIRKKGQLGSEIYTYSKDWNPVDISSAKYDPYLASYMFPLQVGKSWNNTADKMLFASGKHGKFFVKGKVLAYEKVTVPAGTFDAYKIQVDTEGFGTDEDANTGKTTEISWYAPAAKRAVRIESTFLRDGRVRRKDISELLEFSLR